MALLLGNVEEATVTNELARRVQDRLISARLGVASSLFTALRAKHVPTAQHCLRVALRCSSLAQVLQLDAQALDDLEIAALLHDIGKISVPDHVLSKPGPLTTDESQLMDRQRTCGLEILSASVSSPSILNIVRYSAHSYDGRQPADGGLSGDDLPLGARILAIADAFDAMTTDHVYRPALPRERALAELFVHAGTQFDPQLVREFAKLSARTEANINASVSQRWARQLSADCANALWQLRQPLFAGVSGPTADALFQQRLLDAMHDGVVFIDSRQRIVLWNRGAERLTGISPESVYEKTWSCEILGLRDKEGNPLPAEHCPVTRVINTGVQTMRRFCINTLTKDRVFVDMHIIPVIDGDNRCCGATLLMHDVSSETSLEERVQDLHEQATTDPLTGVSNRAEFDRVHAEMVSHSLAQGTTCSIIICDIDRFKQVNDLYGHQAGDEVLVNFAGTLQRFRRRGDLVARYGGEEFVMLCAECDNASAARLAEQIRHELAATPQTALAQKCITASFGVTEVQPGDTPETMLRRADRALYQAKDTGRNRVVQLGTGYQAQAAVERRGWFHWLRRKPVDALVERTLMASVPMNVLAEKIKGFIADHNAEIHNIEENYIVLSIDGKDIGPQRRRSDRPVNLAVELRLSESKGRADRQLVTKTIIQVSIRPLRNRDRRGAGSSQAAQILASLKSYLVAQEYVGH